MFISRLSCVYASLCVYTDVYPEGYAQPHHRHGFCCCIGASVGVCVCVCVANMLCCGRICRVLLTFCFSELFLFFWFLCATVFLVFVAKKLHELSPNVTDFLAFCFGMFFQHFLKDIWK